MSCIQALTAEEDAQRRWQVLHESRFHRSMVRLEAIIEKLRREVNKLAACSRQDIIADWLAAGLPMPDPDAPPDHYSLYIEGLLRTVDEVSWDAKGFRWTVECFLAVLVSNS